MTGAGFGDRVLGCGGVVHAFGDGSDAIYMEAARRRRSWWCPRTRVETHGEQEKEGVAML